VERLPNSSTTAVPASFSPGSSSLVAFTEDAFRILLRSQFDGSRLLVAEGPAVDLVVRTLDAAPDPAVSWVYGLYATVLNRLPSGGELLTAAERLRSGTTPEGLLEELLSSDEAQAGGADAPKQLETAYVTGCYLSALGRRPDVGGLNHHLASYAATASEQGVLDGLTRSDEAALFPRFPPAFFPLEVAIGEALQTVVLGQAPLDSLTPQLAAQYLGGVSVATLVRQLLLKDRRLRAKARAFLISRQLTGQVMVEAQLRKLERDLAAQRGWEWRVTRRTWEMMEQLHIESRDLLERVLAASPTGGGQWGRDAEYARS
jgi:hypothetical protein